MCPHKEWFFKFEEVDDGVVYMGSSDVSYITRMDSIWLMNHHESIRVLTYVRYLLKTVDVGLIFERYDTCDQYAIGFVDSDYAGDMDKRQSTTSYVLITLSRALVG